MGHTNSTANLALPQFIGTDKPTWLSDVNGAFAAIDTYAGNNDAALAITDAKADTAIGDASSAVTTAGNAATTAGNAAATATAANTVAGNALTVANGINSKVGVLTNLTTTDKSTVVNAINEVNGKDAGDIAYDNTGSGLTATNVQAAVDEVAQGGGGSGMTRTDLWVNNTIPTSSSDTFAATSVALADAITNYDEIEFQFMASSVNPVSISKVYASPAIYASSLQKIVDMTLVNGGTSNDNWGRRATFTDTSNVSFAAGYKNGSQDNGACIPYKIIGIKY